MSATGRAWTRALALAGGIVAIDQATKAAIVGGLERGEHVDLVLGFDLSYVTNRGIAFGILADGRGAVIAVTLTALALVVGWLALHPERPWMWLAVGLLAGGALGNLADRVRDDAVVDFIDPPLWPAFNLADVAITAGAGVLALTVLGAGRRPPDRPSSE